MAPHEIVKDYEYEKGKYALIMSSEMANLGVPSKHVVEVNQFVELSKPIRSGSRNPTYFDRIDLTTFYRYKNLGLCI